MANLLSNEDITVLGGPASLSVDLDFGPTGQRGSYWIVGNGNPNDPDTEIGQTPQVQDMYLNLDSANAEYLSVYQYQTGIGSTSWVKLVNLLPKIYSQNVSTEFTVGSATINIPIINIIPESSVGTVTSEMFNVQHSIVNNESPLTSSLNVGGIIIDNGLQVLPLTIVAKQYSEGAWEDLSGQKMVHLFISVV
jgi:hypothetical protein